MMMKNLCLLSASVLLPAAVLYGIWPEPAVCGLSAALAGLVVALTFLLFSKGINASWTRFAASFGIVFAVHGACFLALAILAWKAAGHAAPLLFTYGASVTAGTLCVALRLPTAETGRIDVR